MVDGRGTALGSSQCVAPDDRDRAQLISSARVTGHRDMPDAGAPVEPFQAVELLDRQAGLGLGTAMGSAHSADECGPSHQCSRRLQKHGAPD